MTAEGFTLSTSPTSPRSTGKAIDDCSSFAGPEQRSVLARQADREWPVLVEQSDQLAPHLTGQNHADDLHDLGGGHPQTGLELGHQADPVKHRCDLWATAVDDDRPQPRVAQEHDVLGESRLERVIDHGVAAVLDDDERSPEPFEPRQRLDQGLCFGRRGSQAALSLSGPDQLICAQVIRAHGATPVVGSPVVSGSPKAMLAHCTAAPAVPLVRLSTAATTMTRPVRSSRVT